MNKNNCHVISVVILIKIGLDNFNLICAQIRPKKGVNNIDRNKLLTSS